MCDTSHHAVSIPDTLDRNNHPLNLLRPSQSRPKRLLRNPILRHRSRFQSRHLASSSTHVQEQTATRPSGRPKGHRVQSLPRLLQKPIKCTIRPRCLQTHGRRSSSDDPRTGWRYRPCPVRESESRLSQPNYARLRNTKTAMWFHVHRNDEAQSSARFAVPAVLGIG